MRAYGFKAGTGTSSRRVVKSDWTVGVLVQANHGAPRLLRIAGAPVGAELADDRDAPRAKSIIIVVATDAPLLPHQLKRVAKRASLGLARTGSISSDSSGDIFIAFSTANAGASVATPVANVEMLAAEGISAIFQATVEATEEAIVNAMIGADTLTGYRGATCEAIPHDRVVEILRKYGRIAPA
jgi:L-aminopeptidase/D-esterase-like protein